MIVIDLLLATICFSGQCYPALIGVDTPTGHFNLVQRITEQPGYGGDVLQFHETDDAWYGIHRVFLLNKSQHRDKRLLSSKVSDRIITKGCINVQPEVYEKLRDCCSNMELIIKKN